MIVLLLPFAAAALSWGAMEWRLARRGADGLPADQLVRSTAVSHEALQTLRAVPAGPAKRLAILQPAALHAFQVGDPAADGSYPTLVRTSLAGTWAPYCWVPAARPSRGRRTRTASRRTRPSCWTPARACSTGDRRLRPSST
ncbi:MAG: hypothetical protein IPH09_11345 [bacterium]|nr:hypothetical protein [bacterium]